MLPCQCPLAVRKQTSRYLVPDFCFKPTRDIGILRPELPLCPIYQTKPTRGRELQGSVYSHADSDWLLIVIVETI
jgi:hypothetical protein